MFLVIVPDFLKVAHKTNLVEKLKFQRKTRWNWKGSLLPSSGRSMKQKVVGEFFDEIFQLTARIGPHSISNKSNDCTRGKELSKSNQ